MWEASKSIENKQWLFSELLSDMTQASRQTAFEPSFMGSFAFKPIKSQIKSKG